MAFKGIPTITYQATKEPDMTHVKIFKQHCAKTKQSMNDLFRQTIKKYLISHGLITKENGTTTKK